MEKLFGEYFTSHISGTDFLNVKKIIFGFYFANFLYQNISDFKNTSFKLLSFPL
jgi:hypothetical protein